jgi:hypothetical protein
VLYVPCCRHRISDCRSPARYAFYTSRQVAGTTRPGAVQPQVLHSNARPRRTSHALLACRLLACGFEPARRRTSSLKMVIRMLVGMITAPPWPPPRPTSRARAPPGPRAAAPALRPAPYAPRPAPRPAVRPPRAAVRGAPTGKALGAGRPAPLDGSPRFSASLPCGGLKRVIALQRN